jgi:hypothetical protein
MAKRLREQRSTVLFHQMKQASPVPSAGAAAITTPRRSGG